MPWPDIAQRFYKSAQLLFQFDVDLEGGTRSPLRVAKIYAPSAPDLTSPSERPIHLRRRDPALESQTRELLRELGAGKLAREVRVEWNPRLKTIAGRADYREKLISLNPLLRNVDNGLAQTESRVGKLDRWSRSSLTSDSGHKLDCLKQSSFASTGWNSRHAATVCDEVDRTLRHELAHLLAHFRVGCRRIAPHGPEWRRACRDLGIADEARCHNLPFATKVYPARFVYRCPNCRQKFPRVRKIRRAIACLACCRKHNDGDFDPRLRLKLTTKL